MSIYYFHMVYRDETRLDPVGSELPNDAAAIDEARAAAREMVIDRIRYGRRIHDIIFDVVADTGRPVARVPLKSIIRTKF